VARRTRIPPFGHPVMDTSDDESCIGAPTFAFAAGGETTRGVFESSHAARGRGESEKTRVAPDLAPTAAAELAWFRRGDRASGDTTEAAPGLAWAAEPFEREPNSLSNADDDEDDVHEVGDLTEWPLVCGIAGVHRRRPGRGRTDPISGVVTSKPGARYVGWIIRGAG
jgi:hypothetical protein